MNILITGSSRGIGFHTALAFALEKENHVFAVSRDQTGLDRLNQEFQKINASGKLTLIAGDIRSEIFLAELNQRLTKDITCLHVLINNAGFLKYLPFEELSGTDWREIYEANVFGPANLIRSLLPLMKQSDVTMNGKKNHIVNISSIGGVKGSVKFKGLSAYSSSKGALCILTECLAEEFKEENIAVNCLALGSVQTEMFTQAFPGAIAARQPKEMGDYIARFASEGSKFFNGKVLEVSVSTP